MKIIEYQSKYKEDFIRLNTAWIEKYFKMEQEDYDILYHADELLQKGAMIYFAVEEETVIATCMVVPLHDSDWEICKLATAQNHQGHGTGNAIFKACMEYAIHHGAKRLVIVSNSMLKPAMRIYKKYGFREIPVDKTHNYQRADIQFEYLV